MALTLGPNAEERYWNMVPRDLEMRRRSERRPVAVAVAPTCQNAVGSAKVVQRANLR
jgi:hypothetical protein